MKKIKVCYLLNDFAIGGVSSVVYESLSQINLEAYDVLCLLLSKNTGYLDTRSLDPRISIKFADYQFSKNYSLRAYFMDMMIHPLLYSKFSNVIQEIREFFPDILHLHTHPRELVIGSIYFRKYPNTKLVYTDHSVRISTEEMINKKTQLLSAIYRRHYKNYNLISVSKAVFFTHKRCKWQNSKLKCVLIENKIDLNRYQQIKIEKKEILTVIYVTRLSENKGIEQLLNVWQKLQIQNSKLKLVGDGPLYQLINEKIKKGIIKNLHLVGFVSDVNAELRTSDIAVFPSEREGLPIALLEKMAVGLPIIVNNIPELTDFIKDEENGLVFKNQDEFFNKLTRLMQDLELRRKLGTNARYTIKERFGNTSYIKLLEDFYLELVSR